MSCVNKITEETVLAEDGRAARWQQHRTDRQRELLQLARKAVHHLGPQASMDDIARHANTSKPVYYRYFSDKEGLRQALSNQVISEFHDRVVSAGLAGHDELDSLHAMVSAYLEFAQSSPSIYAFVTTGPSTALNDFFTEITTLMTERLQALYAPEAGTAPAIALWPTAALGMVRAAGESWLAQPEAGRPALDALASQLTGWLAYGISASANPTLKGSRHD